MNNSLIFSLKKRFNFLVYNRFFSFHERLGIFCSYGDKQIKKLITSRLITNNNQKFFKIGNYRIFFDVNYNVRDYEYFFNGIRQVISESFIYPEYWIKECRPAIGSTVFDIGANIGTISLIISDMIGTKGNIYAFEPVTHKILYKNIKKNKISNVKVIPIGISNKKESVEIKISEYFQDSSFINPNVSNSDHFFMNKIIEVTSIDDFVDNNGIEKIDFIKVDVEGAEELVLKGANNTILKCYPKWSIASYHADSQNERQHPKLISFLKKFDYKIKQIEDKHIWAYI
jgi:FkbM family methyltransferase